jgi:exonuclease SbcD
MKIIHTADWHIGKILHKQELYADISLFFDWLEQYIIDEKIDVLLVAGDVYDLANPSNRDTRLYFNFLRRLSRTGVKTIITGGNHDSVSLLHASADLLQELNITVIGGVPEDFDQQLVPIYHADGNMCCVVLAVPFLRDRDLRVSVSADESLEKTQIIPKAIKQHYDRLVSAARTIYGEVPLIAMGHLFMQGSLISDSERDIHVGNLLGLDGKMIPGEIAYMALGHIHKPQRIDKQDHIRYSGSPIYLDFSEAGYEKLVIQVDIDGNKLDIKPIKLPKFRNLLRLKGGIEEIQAILNQYNNEHALPTFVELEILEDMMNPSAIHEMQTMETAQHAHYKVIKSRITFGNQNQGKGNVEYKEIIENLSPQQIFEIRLSHEQLDEQAIEDVKIAYNQILESLQD